MAARKSIAFNDDFNAKLKAGETSRGDTLRATTLAEIQSARVDIGANPIANRLKFLEEIGFSDITLGEIADGGPRRNEFIQALVDKGANTRTNEIVQDFPKILDEIGVKGERGTNTFRTYMINTVGKDAYLKAGFSTTVDRLIPLFYPPEVYPEVKNTVAGLLNSEDAVRREAGVRMLLMMQGGYRPSDFKGLNIENIDFETGRVKELDLKTDSKDNVEGAGKRSVSVAYMPSAQRDVILHHIKGRNQKTGPLFLTKASTLDNIINNALAEMDIPDIEYYSEKTDSYVKDKFSSYDFRRMMETHLSAEGYPENSTVRRALTWRPLEGNQQKYQSIINEAGRIEQANSAAFQSWVLMSEGNMTQAGKNMVRTHAQFLTEVGIEEVSDYTKRYSITAQAVDNLPPFMQDRALKFSEGVTFANDNVARIPINTDPEGASLYKQISKSTLRKRAAQLDIEAAELEKIAEDTRINNQVEADLNTSAPDTFSGFTEEDRTILKEGGMWTDEMEEQHQKRKGLAAKGIKAGLTAAGTVISKGAKSAVPGLFFEQRRQELMDRGDSPEIATVKAGAEELITPLGISAAVVEGVGEPLAEEIQKQTPPEGMLQGLGRAFTGQGMNIKFQSGGFVNKYGR